MKMVVDPGKRDATLRRYQGGSAKIWLYHITMRRMALRIAHPALPEVLYVVGIGCDRIEGPFAWAPADVAVTDRVDHSNGENVCDITDAASGFNLRCSTASLATGPANELDHTFENFLGDSPNGAQTA
jgi:hypothetical protein